MGWAKFSWITPIIGIEPNEDQRLWAQQILKRFSLVEIQTYLAIHSSKKTLFSLIVNQHVCSSLKILKLDPLCETKINFEKL
jgi:hypothetical protein